MQVWCLRIFFLWVFFSTMGLILPVTTFEIEVLKHLTIAFSLLLSSFWNIWPFFILPILVWVCERKTLCLSLPLPLQIFMWLGVQGYGYKINSLQVDHSWVWTSPKAPAFWRLVLPSNPCQPWSSWFDL